MSLDLANTDKLAVFHQERRGSACRSGRPT